MDVANLFRFVLAFVVVLGLIGGFAWVLRRYGTGRVMTAGGKGRLGVVEVAAIDAKRRLVLVRRDETEHLLLLSPTHETVVETGIAETAVSDFIDHLVPGTERSVPAPNHETSS